MLKHTRRNQFGRGGGGDDGDGDDGDGDGGGCGSSGPCQQSKPVGRFRSKVTQSPLRAWGSPGRVCFGMAMGLGQFGDLPSCPASGS